MEMLASISSEFDVERYGVMPMPTPRQSDVYFISGLITKKALPIAKRVRNRMPEPKRVIAVGACAAGGGLYRDSYSVVNDVPKHFPIKVFVPGCPPRPEAIIKGRVKLRKILMGVAKNGGKNKSERA